jgi:hypothetical protein
MIPENMIEIKASDKAVSPWFKGNEEKSTGDYILIKVDSPLRPDNYIRPIEASDNRLVSADANGEISVHLFRGKTGFKTNKSGVPDFIDNNSVSGSLNEYAKIYQKPQKVNTPCQIGFSTDGVLGNNCPTESLVSGSPYVSNIDGKNYLIGMHILGVAALKNDFDKNKAGRNAFIQSKHFCKDYKNICGMECAKLSDVLPEKRAELSI